MADNTRGRAGRRLPRWATVAGFLVLAACGCSVAPTPAINGFPAGPGAPGSAVAGPGQGAAPGAANAPAAIAGPAAAAGRPLTYASLGRHALATLEGEYYNGAGEWNLCVPVRCGSGNRDWGVDSLTYVLYLHWLLTGDRTVAPIMNALTATSPDSHSGVSDVPLWDSIAAAREYQVTGNPLALRKAESRFRLGGRQRATVSAPAPAPASSTSTRTAEAPSSRRWRPMPTTSRPRCCSTRSPTSAAT